MAIVHASDAYLRTLENYGLASILVDYALPDFPHLRQEFLWQEYDYYPDFPRMHRLVDFWHKNIEGRILRVQIEHARLLSRTELKLIGIEYRLQ